MAARSFARKPFFLTVTPCLLVLLTASEVMPAKVSELVTISSMPSSFPVETQRYLPTHHPKATTTARTRSEEWLPAPQRCHPQTKQGNKTKKPKQSVGNKSAGNAR